VAFADINLSEERIVGTYSPGAGGWPTIRYFNRETGYDGAPYEQKTTDAMCTELGPNKPYLQDYIESAGSTELCSATELSGCTAEEAEWFATIAAASAEEAVALRGGLMAQLDAVGNDWVDQGPWPCLEDGCPQSKEVGCDLETGVGTNCVQKLGALFDQPDAENTDYAKYVWELCPSACPEQVATANTERQQALALQLRRLELAGSRNPVVIKDEM